MFFSRCNVQAYLLVSTIIKIFSRQIPPARSTTHSTYPTDLTVQIRSMITTLHTLSLPSITHHIRCERGRSSPSHRYLAAATPARAAPVRSPACPCNALPDHRPPPGAPLAASAAAAHPAAAARPLLPAPMLARRARRSCTSPLARPSSQRAARPSPATRRPARLPSRARRPPRARPQLTRPLLLGHRPPPGVPPTTSATPDFGVRAVRPSPCSVRPSP